MSVPTLGRPDATPDQGGATLFGSASEALRFLATNRQLILAMARREIATRYAGQAFGGLWAVIHPVFQMALFVFVFAVVFQQRIGGTHDLPRDYATYVLAGLSAWLPLSAAITQAATSVTSNASLIKQFTFDARVLPVRDCLVTLVAWLVSVSIVLIYSAIANGGLPWTILLLPVVAAVHVGTALGCAWILAAIGVFFRDVKDFVVIANTAMVYVLPVVYLPAWVPDLFRPVIYANPFSYVVWMYQDVLYFGRIEHPLAWTVAPVLAALCFALGYRTFTRLRPLFGNVL